MIVENEKGLQVAKLQDKGVAEPKSLYFIKKNEGLQVCFACVHSRFVLWYETAFSIPEEGDKMALPKDKCKFSLWLYPETLDRVKELYQRDDCQSQSEFIEKAIRFYVGFLRADDESSYLPNAFLSNLKSIVAESDIRQSRMLFKIAVEMAMMMNVLAASQDIDGATLARLRGECIKEVKRLNGNFTMEDACEWQKG